MQTQNNQDCKLSVRAYTDHDLESKCELTQEIKLPTAELKACLVSPRPRQACRPLSEWSESLRRELGNIYVRPRTRAWIEKALDMLNQAVSVFIFSGQNKRARDVCYTQIHMLLMWSQQPGFCDLLRHAFKPWINLMIIDRREGRLLDAFEKSTVFVRKGQYGAMHQHGLSRKLMEEALYEDKNLLYSVLLNASLETINLFFQLENYHELMGYLDTLDALLTGMNHLCIPEARYVAYVKLGFTDRASELMRREIRNHPATTGMVLKLRDCEQRLLMGQGGSLLPDIQHLYYLAWERVSVESGRYCHMDFVLHTARVTGMAGQVEEAVKLAEYSYFLATQIENEFMQADCLVLLYQLANNSERKRQIEDMMIMHYFNTHYTVSREILLDCCQGLKFVEFREHHDELAALFSDCMAVEYWHGHY